jgi:hypothetical protein
MPRSTPGKPVRRLFPRLLVEFIAFAALIGTLLVLSPLGSVWVQLSVDSSGAGTSTMHYEVAGSGASAVRSIHTGSNALQFVYPPSTIAHGTSQVWTPCDCGATATVHGASIRSVLISTPATATASGPSFAISGSPRTIYLENLALLVAIAAVLSIGGVALLERVRRRSRRPQLRGICAFYVSAAIVFITGAVMLRFGNWGSTSPSSDSIGFVTSTLPTFAIAGFLLLIGVAALSLMPRYRWGRGSIGISIGIGMAVISVIVGLTHKLLGNATIAILPVGLAAAAILIVKIVLRLRSHPDGYRYGLLQLWLRVRFAAGLQTSLVVLVLSIAVIAPLARYGLTAWTHGTNDFRSYVGSTQIWLAPSPAPFAAQHTDSFGAHQLYRASFEKPFSTAFLVVATQVTGLATYKLLTPTTILLVFVLIAVSAYIARRAFRLAEPLTWIVAIIPALSIVPFSRVIDAQPGQAIGAALLATFIALWISLTYRGRKWMPVWGIILSAIVACATLGSNFTLVASVLPSLVVALFWLASRRGDEIRGTLRNLAALAIATIILCVPFVTMFVNSFVSQTNGDSGFNIPLATPLALIGQQVSLSPSFGPVTNAILWIIVLAAAAAAFVVTARRSVSIRWLAALVAVTVVTFLAVGLKLGFDNYAAHKYTALVIAVFLPLGFALLFTAGRPRMRRIVVPVATVASASALVIAVLAGTSVAAVVSLNLISLESNSRLKQASELNIDINGFGAELLAPLIVPARHITTVEPNVGFASAPVGNLFLIDHTTAAAYPWKSITPLNDQYSTGTIDVSLGAGMTSFAAGNSSATRFLFGNWYPADTDGTWATGKDSFLVFDPAAGLAGQNVTVTVTGIVDSTAGSARTLTVLANGTPVKTLQSASGAPVTLTFTVPSAAIAANQNRVALDFTVANGMPLPKQTDPTVRNLGFQLQSMTIAAG